MLSKKSVYRVVTLLAIISLPAASIARESKQSGIFPEFSKNAKETVEVHIAGSVVSGETVPANIQNRPENRMFAGGLDPKMLKEQEEAAVSTIDLRSGRHDEYLRVVLEGPHEIISAGEVRHKAHVVSVTFPDANFSLRENNIAVPFRREQNKVLFTQNNLEKIRVHNLSKPDRLAIDFYIKKAGSNQQKVSQAEIVNKQKAVALEKIQPGSNTMEQKEAEQKQGMTATTSIPAVEIPASVSLMIPGITGGDSNSDSEGEVKQAEEEEFETISKKEVQKTVDKRIAEPAGKDIPTDTVKAPVELMVSNMPEVNNTPEITVEKNLDASSVHEKAGSVKEHKEIKEWDHKELETYTEASSAAASKKLFEALNTPAAGSGAGPLDNAEPDATFPSVVQVKLPDKSLFPHAPEMSGITGQPPEKQESEGAALIEADAERSLENSGPVIIADVKKETVPVEKNDVKDDADVQSVREVTETYMQTEEVKRKIALLPFDNFSNNNDALDKIMPLILARLEDRGFDVTGYEEVEAFLCERRIRNSTFISKEVATELGKNKMVSSVVAGAVLTFSSSSEENPKIGILARLLDIATGHIIWSDFVSLTGEDFTKVLGLGTITSIDLLVPRALDRLFANFGNTSPHPSGKDIFKIAVLPFKNETEHRHAGKIITHLFQNELANNPMFDPVDFGDTRQNIINLRIGGKGAVDYNNLQALSKSLGVDAVLTGTVEEYQSGWTYSSPPSVTISARLLDSRKNRILWYDNLQLDGEENIIALDWGRLRTADKVAYGAVSGLVKHMKTEGLLQ